MPTQQFVDAIAIAVASHRASCTEQWGCTVTLHVRQALPQNVHPLIQFLEAVYFAVAVFEP